MLPQWIALASISLSDCKSPGHDLHRAHIMQPEQLTCLHHGQPALVCHDSWPKL
jgi:hypothetical protein